MRYDRFILVAAVCFMTEGWVLTPSVGAQDCSDIDVFLNQECLPAEEPRCAGISCQVAGDGEWNEYPAYIQNAKKGDMILVRGTGAIGQLVQQLCPPQKYSHEGLMTMARYEVRHSTAVQDRYGDHLRGFGGRGTEGINLNALRFSWPGTITQEVGDAFNKGVLRSEDDGKTYENNGFFGLGLTPALDQDQNVVIVSPVVITTPRDCEDLVRPLLKEVGEEAKLVQGHYRWFGYSRADLLQDLIEPSDSDSCKGVPAPEGMWATDDSIEEGGPAGTVSSVFMWAAPRRVADRRDRELESSAPTSAADTLECTDPDFVRQEHPDHDGLYVYTAKERKKAGEFMYTEVYNRAYAKAGPVKAFFSDAPDDTANQFVNCMTFDWCGPECCGEADDPESSTFCQRCVDDDPDDDEDCPDTVYVSSREAKDSTAWRSHTGIGITVSPDDLMSFDPPQGDDCTGGLYGKQPMDLWYRGAEYLPRHVWAPAPGSGTVNVHVVQQDGSAIGEATVRLGPREELTDGDGQAVFDAIPAGTRATSDGEADQPAVYRVMATRQFLPLEGGELIDEDGWIDVEVYGGETTEVELVISTDVPAIPTSDLQRIVRLVGTIHIKDDDWPDADDKKDFSLCLESLPLVSEGDTFEFRLGRLNEYCSDEVKVEVDINVRLDRQRIGGMTTTVVQVTSNEARLYEGSSCHTDDKEDTQVSPVFEVGTIPEQILYELCNGGALGDDNADIRLAIVAHPVDFIFSCPE